MKGLIVETSVAREEVKKRPMLYVAKEQHVKNDALWKQEKTNRWNKHVNKVWNGRINRNPFHRQIKGATDGILQEKKNNKKFKETKKRRVLTVRSFYRKSGILADSS